MFVYSFIIALLGFSSQLKLVESGQFQFKESVGGIWPRPAQLELMKNHPYLSVHPSEFLFQTTQFNCDILEKAKRRYLKLMFAAFTRTRKNVHNFVYDSQYILDILFINLLSPCEKYPHEFMDESYVLSIRANKSVLRANSIWGILHGLETFSQIVIPVDNDEYIVYQQTLNDKPYYPHRGLLIDTGRHYLPMRTIFSVLNAMAYSKMNVLHWHIVDDQSFPFKSSSFPNLSEKGAFSPMAIYTERDVKFIIEHARIRGIRVIPEFDTPGHTYSWGEGIPGLLTKCKSPTGKDFGPIDPSVKKNYEYIRLLLQEVKDLFPDKYIHIGGDEVDHDCWKNNVGIRDYMRKNNISSIKNLEAHYMKTIDGMITQLNGKSIVWQDAYDTGAKLAINTVIQVWKGWMSANPESALSQITKKGHRVIDSSCWFLDNLENDWKKFYSCDPSRFSDDEKQKKLILGGEACMWGEYVDEFTINSRIWPRACATAEVLWSGYGSLDIDEVAMRLGEHVCRLRLRGIPAEAAIGPGHCSYHTKKVLVPVHPGIWEDMRSSNSYFSDKGEYEV